ncbi:hypothetical protein [Nostoc sp.]
MSFEHLITAQVKARDTMNRRQDKTTIVETAIYRVFVMIYRIFAI